MKKIAGLIAAAALTLAACTSGPAATETGVPTPELPQPATLNVPEDVIKTPGTDVCANMTVPAGATAGQIIAASQIQDGSGTVTGVDAAAWRVSYVSILSGDKDLVPVCGMVVAPRSGNTDKVVNWTHGTVGLTDRCLPFRKGQGMNGPFAGGGLGDDGRGFNGMRELLTAGYTVLATDYYSPPVTAKTARQYQPYAAGVAQAANALDLMRAVYPYGATFAMWGHSQGGGSSLWAGQIAARYVGPNYVLKGVAAAAPASQFVATPDQPKAWVGKHLGDRDAYNFIAVKPGTPGLVPIGDVLFSYVMQAWGDLSLGSELQGWRSLPDSVRANAPLKVQAVLTPLAVDASAKIAKGVCLDNFDGETLASLTDLGPFLATHKGGAEPFFAEPFQGAFVPQLPGKSVSAIDSSCLSKLSLQPQVKKWCEALAFNMPGPNGTSGYDKMPPAGTPVFLAQGTADNVIWCMSQDAPTNPTAVDCLTQQLYEGMKAVPGASVKVSYYPGADHFGVMPASGQDTITYIKSWLG